MLSVQSRINMSVFETIPHMAASLLWREVVLLTLTLLCLTAPLSWPYYTACLLILTIIVSCSAHVTFRQYQLASGSCTVVNSLLYLLSVFLQAIEIHSEAILLLRLLWRDGSLCWYQSQPLVFCILLSPRLSLSIFNEQVFKNSELVKIQYNGFSIS